MDIKAKLAKSDTGELREVLTSVLIEYNTPAFGALSKREADLLIFEAMISLRLFTEDTPVYEIISALNISRAKARQLLFDIEVRKSDQDDLDKRVKDALCAARFHKDMDKFFLLEIDSQLVSAHLKEKVRKLGFVSDGSFNSAIVKLPQGALSAVIEELLDATQGEMVKSALVKAGAKPDPSLRAVIRESITTVCSRFVGDMAGDLVDGAGDHVMDAYLRPLFDNAPDITEVFSEAFKPKKD